MDNKSQQIPILNNKKYLNEYELKENLFNPFKGSPPNYFIIKLHKRLNNYNKEYNFKTK
jgi:hypothetical protein